MFFIYLFLGVILTAIVYMAFPLIRLLINGKRFPKKRANKIALLNSIIVGAIFFIATAALSESATTWNVAPAFMYYWINKAILTDKHMDEADQVLSEEDIEKQKRRKKVKSIILKSILSLVLGVITAELLLMILLGNSVQGLTALLLVALFGLVCAGGYFCLFFFVFKRKKKE